ncbi:YbaB/EbfC family nucleoid-associated protein [Microbacterium sp. cx-55]|uniref:YbaB/EbfC family nucleoid-associated protein n=1 Tax=Microbacterium sp. cx-55 TaxID=2875948 RepID=UPI001CC17781|nr:YbaB/EbfC family nucleoid-associated protein [Microbacterium sp. cx-55]MBZ4488095.1 YbaB/EbfC family nucleoid-associated protein [Microbacterium sp. cx-55]UGB34496.1 YbaB/EbfC family nucleoid-associated protein [Microbacterium sp. cx-55]
MVFEDADAAILRVEEDVRRAQQRAERYPALQAGIDEVRARAVSLRRDIAVEVDASGVLRNLEISDAALDRGGRQVSREVMALLSAAHRDARAKTLALTAEIMGEDDPIVKAVAADLEAQETGSHAWRTGGTV